MTSIPQARRRQRISPARQALRTARPAAHQPDSRQNRTASRRLPPLLAAGLRNRFNLIPDQEAMP
jgi:hypothetical protein